MDMRQVSALYRLLGDEARLRLLRVLDRERLNVTELTGILGLAQSGVSRHLGLLKDAGLVSEEKDAGYTYYRLAPALSENGHRAIWSALKEQFAAGGKRCRRAGRRGAAAGSAAAAEGKFRDPRRGRRARRAAVRARTELGGVVARARPPAAAAHDCRSRLRRGLSHHRSVALGGARHRGRSLGRRARPGQGAGPAPPGVERRVETRRARETADQGRDGRRRAAVSGAAPRGEPGAGGGGSGAHHGAGRPGAGAGSAGTSRRVGPGQARRPPPRIQRRRAQDHAGGRRAARAARRRRRPQSRRPFHGADCLGAETAGRDEDRQSAEHDAIS